MIEFKIIELESNLKENKNIFEDIKRIFNLNNQLKILKDSEIYKCQLINVKRFLRFNCINYYYEDDIPILVDAILIK